MLIYSQYKLLIKSIGELIIKLPSDYQCLNFSAIYNIILVKET